MAKLIVQHDEDPGIAIILTEGAPGSGHRGWSGTCTECGRPMHRWDQRLAVESAQAHVDRHVSTL